MHSRQLFHRHKDSVYWKQARRVFTFVLACLVWLSVVPQALGFIVFEHVGLDDLNTLIKKVHAPQWTIHYSYGDNCPVEERNNDAALTAAVTEVLQMWLQPLRDYTQKPIVNDFRYQRIDIVDWRTAPDPSIIFRPADLGIVFHCDLRTSHAHMGRLRFEETSYLEMHSTTNAEQTGFMPGLIHEMGHVFGLADTYAVPVAGELGLSKGGLDSTRGRQPEAIMAGSSWHRDGGPVLGRDDKNGLIWLYKHIYENQPLEDCFFIDYALENVPRGCVPKHPLIFELKHGLEVRALRMLEEDENLDLNAQDADGMTALHSTVIRFAEEKDAPETKAVIGFLDVVKALLAHEAILPFLRDTHGRSALQIARENKLDRMITLLLAHPLTLPVNPKGKLTTTWGHLKRRY